MGKTFTQPSATSLFILIIVIIFVSLVIFALSQNWIYVLIAVVIVILVWSNKMWDCVEIKFSKKKRKKKSKRKLLNCDDELIQKVIDRYHHTKSISTRSLTNNLKDSSRISRVGSLIRPSARY